MTTKAQLDYCQNCRLLIGQRVTVTVTRPLGSVHPKHSDLRYYVNYGHVKGFVGGDGDWQDAYVLGVEQPVQSFTGRVIAVVVRRNDVETKLVVAPEGAHFPKRQIARTVHFQEKYFDHIILTE
ncbi:MAG TPA: inorganic pyrophosphatase [Candidatus Fimimonas merdipullorum]|uniref:Inorganic pyrophosphatase n=1 Tax=Candidatus Fimimonas merdipullorum TaxID=2840822 RepID=A0A9D1SPD1_9BACT|nr:inorganic pyrophosphatase [Candidatus Fimimonas merdipullorum]